MEKKHKINFLVILILGLLAHQAAQAQTTVYLRPEQALKQLFQGSQEVIQEKHDLTSERLKKAKELLKYDLPKSSYTFYLGKTGTHVDGYALIDEQIGKVSPITFVSRISPQGKVDAVEIMVYRESHGGEVSSKRFLNQFKAKGLNDEIRLHGNIINITGATLSSQALVTGVNRALVLWKILYGNGNP